MKKILSILLGMIVGSSLPAQPSNTINNPILTGTIKIPSQFLGKILYIDTSGVMQQVAVGGGLSFNPPNLVSTSSIPTIATVTTTGTIGTAFDYIVGNASSGITQSLPANPLFNQRLVLKNIGAGLMTVSGNGHLIDGFSTLPLIQWASYTLTWDSNDNLWIIGN